MSVQGVQKGERLFRHFRLKCRVIDVIERCCGRGRLEIRQLSQSDHWKGHHCCAKQKREQSAHEPQRMMCEGAQSILRRRKKMLAWLLCLSGLSSPSRPHQTNQTDKTTRSTSSFPCFRCWQCSKRIVRPMVFGIAAAEFFAHLLLGSGPKAGEIFGHFDRPFGR